MPNAALAFRLGPVCQAHADVREAVTPQFFRAFYMVAATRDSPLSGTLAVGAQVELLPGILRRFAKRRSADCLPPVASHSATRLLEHRTNTGLGIPGADFAESLRGRRPGSGPRSGTPSHPRVTPLPARPTHRRPRPPSPHRFPPWNRRPSPNSSPAPAPGRPPLPEFEFLFDLVTKHRPADPKIQTIAGWSFLGFGNPSRALELFAAARALPSEKPDPNLFAGLAAAQWANGAKEEAKLTYLSVLGMNDKHYPEDQPPTVPFPILDHLLALPPRSRRSWSSSPRFAPTCAGRCGFRWVRLRRAALLTRLARCGSARAVTIVIGLRAPRCRLPKRLRLPDPADQYR